MQKVFYFVKCGFKYTTIVLALILMVGQICNLLTEEEHNDTYKENTSQSENHSDISKNSSINEKLKSLYMTLTDKDIKNYDFDKVNECEGHKSSTYNIFNALMKCFLAFLAGGLLSDMKFLKFGVF